MRRKVIIASMEHLTLNIEYYESLAIQSFVGTLTSPVPQRDQADSGDTSHISSQISFKTMSLSSTCALKPGSFRLFIKGAVFSYQNLLLSEVFSRMGGLKPTLHRSLKGDGMARL